jgi:hypothetical protein
VAAILKQELGKEQPRGYYVDHDSDWPAGVQEAQEGLRGQVMGDIKVLAEDLILLEGGHRVSTSLPQPPRN